MFHFRLDKILRHRQLQETQTQQKVLESTRQFQELKSQIHSLETQLWDFIDHSDVAFLYYRDRSRAGYLSKIDQLKKQLHVLDTERKKRLFEHLEARKQVRVLEVLKQKRFQSYRQQELKQQDQLMDEVARDVVLARNPSPKNEQYKGGF